MATPVQIGILLYPNVTQLDATGPAQVLSRVPGAKMHMIWKTLAPVPTDAGFSIVPTTTFADCPKLDVICVPGGGGQVALMTDEETLDFLRKQAATVRPKSMPAVTPPPEMRLRSRTTRSATGMAPNAGSMSRHAQWQADL